MPDGKDQNQAPQMTIGKGIGIYAALLFVFFVLVKLAVAVSWFPEAIPFFAYFAFGFTLNRVVLRSMVRWRSFYYTIRKISRSKLHHLLFWPISYAILFVRLGVIKYL